MPDGLPDGTSDGLNWFGCFVVDDAVRPFVDDVAIGAVICDVVPATIMTISYRGVIPLLLLLGVV
jgi:hypothetical protein